MVIVELAHGVKINVRLAGFGPEGSNRQRVSIGTCDDSTWHGVGEVPLEMDEGPTEEDILEGPTDEQVAQVTRASGEELPDRAEETQLAYRPPNMPPMMPPLSSDGVTRAWPKFVCPECAASFDQERSLQQHMWAKGHTYPEKHVQEPIKWWKILERGGPLVEQISALRELVDEATARGDAISEIDRIEQVIERLQAVCGEREDSEHGGFPQRQGDEAASSTDEYHDAQHSKRPEQRRCINPDCSFRQHPKDEIRGVGYCCKRCEAWHNCDTGTKPKRQHGLKCQREEASDGGDVSSEVGDIEEIEGGSAQAAHDTEGTADQNESKLKKKKRGFRAMSSAPWRIGSAASSTGPGYDIKFKSARIGETPFCRKFNDHHCAKAQCNFVHVCNALMNNGEACGMELHGRVNHEDELHGATQWA